MLLVKVEVLLEAEARDAPQCVLGAARDPGGQRNSLLWKHPLGSAVSMSPRGWHAYLQGRSLYSDAHVHCISEQRKWDVLWS